jgi:hypothetical protein
MANLRSSLIVAAEPELDLRIALKEESRNPCDAQGFFIGLGYEMVQSVGKKREYNRLLKQFILGPPWLRRVFLSITHGIIIVQAESPGEKRLHK